MLVTNETKVEEISRGLSRLRGKHVSVEAKNITLGIEKFSFWSISGILESSEVYVSEASKAEAKVIYMQFNGLRFKIPIILKSTDEDCEMAIETVNPFMESEN